MAESRIGIYLVALYGLAETLESTITLLDQRTTGS